MWTLCLILAIVGVVAKYDFEELCHGCIRFKGLGYMPYKFCTHYVVCIFDDDGNIDEIRSKIEKCPFGQFWSQRDLTCKPAFSVFCETDLCKDLKKSGFNPGQTTKPWWVSPDVCSQYWSCNGRRTESANCCPPSHGASTYTPLISEACVLKPACEAKCNDPSKTTLSPPNYCDLNMAYPLDPKKYISKSSGKIMYCSQGEIFNREICTCVHDPHFYHGEAREGCVPDLYLPLNNDHRDYSKNKYTVNARGVVLNKSEKEDGGGAGLFAGHDKLSIMAYSNANFDNKFAMNLKFHEKRDISGPQTLITNGCDHTNAPIHVTVNEVGSITGKVLINGKVKILSVSLKEDWPKVLTLAYDGNQVFLQGQYANSSETKAVRKWVNGKVARRQCSLTVGSETDHAANPNLNFKGLIDEVRVYLCIPDHIRSYMNA